PGSGATASVLGAASPSWGTDGAGGGDASSQTSSPPATAPPTHGAARNATAFQQICLPGRRAFPLRDAAIGQTSAGTSSGLSVCARTRAAANASATSAAVW